MGCQNANGILPLQKICPVSKICSNNTTNITLNEPKINQKKEKDTNLKLEVIPRSISSENKSHVIDSIGFSNELNNKRKLNEYSNSEKHLLSNYFTVDEINTKNRKTIHNNKTFSSFVTINKRDNNNDINNTNVEVKLILNVKKSGDNKFITSFEIIADKINNKIVNNDYGTDIIIHTFGKADINDGVIEDELFNVHQFLIIYNKEKKRYYIKDHNEGTGVYVKIDKRTKIEDKMMICFCKEYMLFSIKNSGDPSVNELKIQFVDGLTNKQTIYNPLDIQKIKIGRGKSNTIVCDQIGISHVQCTINYEFSDWYIYDGLEENNHNRKSTNGIWLSAKNQVELNDDITIKTGSVQINCQIINNNI